jgi:integrase
VTLPIDVQFRGVGRLHLRSGTRKKQVRDAMKAMLRQLYPLRVDVLRDIKAGTVTVQEVYERYRLGRLDQLPTGFLMRPLEAAWNDWLDQKEIGHYTEHDYRNALCRLLTHNPRATVADLPATLKTHRQACRGKRPRSFNKDRSATLSFLSSALGAHHWLYGEAARASVLKIPKAVKLPTNPLTAEQARALAGKMPPRHLFSFWGMALTGMRPEEWFEQWECRWRVSGDGVEIDGSKRPASNRTVPLVGEIVKPATKRQAFYRALRKASNQTVAPYDLRRSYAVWLELAGIPTYRQDYYMAHGPKDMNALYKRQRECTPHLAEDAQAIMQVLASPQKSPQSGGR